MQKKDTINENIFSDGAIEVKGAKVHNLKNIDVSIPRHKFTVVTGLSGSGKSSLVFDVLLAEGQRRYIDTFSSYARTFLGKNERPDVEAIEGLSPVVAIEQKTSSNNSRSTVGTVTEIYDFLRLLYARTGTPYSFLSGKPMIKYSEEEIFKLINKEFFGKGIEILSPIVRGRKGHYRELFETLRKKGFSNVFVDGEKKELIPGMQLDRYVIHNIAVVIDKFIVKDEMKERLKEAIHLALSMGKGLLDVFDRKDKKNIRHLSSKMMDPESGIAYPEISPASFSFNSPSGYCKTCKGLGYFSQIDPKKVVSNPDKSLKEGAIKILGKWMKNPFFENLTDFLALFNNTPLTPIKDIEDDVLYRIINGSREEDTDFFFEGITEYLNLKENLWKEDKEVKEIVSQLMTPLSCPSCSGDRINRIARNYKIGNYTIADLSNLELSELLDTLPILQAASPKHLAPVSKEILKEIETRLQFLINIGLGYLSLNRQSSTLSGGESQRIRLATQIGTGLVEVLYLLDEPGIGLHPSDNQKLIASLQKLRDGENTIVVVEHELETMLAADYLIDLGPYAGRHGGEVVFAGAPKDIFSSHSLTANYINNIRSIEIPKKRRSGNGNTLKIIGAKGNNLKNITCSIPLATFTCITGVSGSGKSTLINSTLVPFLSQKLYRSTQKALSISKIEGIESIDKLAVVDQSPLGRTPRSTPATYTNLFTDIRNLFASIPESKARGYKAGRFSFNVSGGRCEECKGNGYKTLEMKFLPNVNISCAICSGKRYTRETLEVRYRGKSIADVLDMTIEEAAIFFEHIPKIYDRLKLMEEVGLGYIKLGQSSTTLSGGENQRVKLAEELSKRDTGNTLYVLDEPTTGLHFEDIRVLLNLIQKLVDKGNTVIVIEHDLDIIKSADYIVDMGENGGKNGGKILFEGSPEELAKQKESNKTAYFIAKKLGIS